MQETLILTAGEIININGNNYTYQPQLKVGRLGYMNVYLEEIQTGLLFENITNGVRDIMEAFNAKDGVQQLHKIPIICNNVLMARVNKTSIADNPLLKLGALLLNKENEDARYITEADINMKVNDFVEEGMPTSFFLHLLNNMLNTGNASMGVMQ